MYYYILNPAAGGGRINKIQEKLKARLKELGIAGEFVKSIGDGDVTKLAAMGARKGYKTIVAVGGNGTVNEVINGIGDSGAAIGIIPIGHANELARTLGIEDWQTACNVLAARKIKEVGIGRVGKHYFISAVNIGLEAQLETQRPNANSPLQKTRFYRKALSWAFSFKPMKATLNFDDKYMVETDFFNIQVLNKHFSKKSRIKDAEEGSMLEVVITGKMSNFDSLKYLMDSESLRQDRKPEISIFKAKKVNKHEKASRRSSRR